MTFDSLGKLDISDRQAKGLALANATANLARPDDPLSDADYLSARVLDVLESYAVQYVDAAEVAAIVAAVTSDPAKRQAAADAAGVDLAAVTDPSVIVPLPPIGVRQ